LLPKLISIAVLGLSLSACGFHPMYSSNYGPEVGQPFDLHIKGSGYSTYKFRRELEKQLALAPYMQSTPYRLDIVVAESLSGTTFAQDATITRAKANLSATYTLKTGNRIIATDQLAVTSSYPITATDEFFTKSAQKSASTRTAISLAEEVAREIVRRLHRSESPLQDTLPKKIIPPTTGSAGFESTGSFEADS